MVHRDYAGKRPTRIRAITLHTHSHLSAWIDLRRLLTDFSRIDDEFERIRILIFLHQLQIGEPLSAFYRIATGKLRLCGFDQIRCNAVDRPSAARRSIAMATGATERPR